MPDQQTIKPPPYANTAADRFPVLDDELPSNGRRAVPLVTPCNWVCIKRLENKYEKSIRTFVLDPALPRPMADDDRRNHPPASAHTKNLEVYMPAGDLELDLWIIGRGGDVDDAVKIKITARDVTMRLHLLEDRQIDLEVTALGNLSVALPRSYCGSR